MKDIVINKSNQLTAESRATRNNGANQLSLIILQRERELMLLVMMRIHANRIHLAQTSGGIRAKFRQTFVLYSSDAAKQNFVAQLSSYQSMGWNSDYKGAK